jgi:phenylacetate-coenzyme A ligase PaaK-like adenylate-forming protein
MKNAPESVTTHYVVQIYKDMKIADEVAISNSFSDYEQALRFYNLTIKEAKKEFFVTLELEIEIIDRNPRYETLRLADNYSE